MGYTREFVQVLQQRIMAKNALIQVVLGPRQVGKTTGVKQVLSMLNVPYIYVNADDLLVPERSWVLEQWQKALALGENTVLVIDEIQKVPNWSEIIKSLWDANNNRIKLIVLGSSSLLLQKGLTESLSGRFELIKVLQWSYTESKKAFGYDLERYLRFGGYPGAVPFEDDYDRWYAYIKESIIETVISKDIFQDNRVGNPALFKQAFEILAHYPAQEVSYTKLLGQLQNKGNVELIKHYINLYSGAYLLSDIQKFSFKAYLSKASSPKILMSCPALVNLYEQDIPNNKVAGRLFELVVGNRLINTQGRLFYWRERNYEVDYIYTYRGAIYAIEVKSGKKQVASGFDRFKKDVPQAKCCIITKENFDVFDENPIRMLETYAL